MTDFFPIVKVPDVDNIFVNYVHASFQGLISEVYTGFKATPISYAFMRNLSECFWGDISLTTSPDPGEQDEVIFCESENDSTCSMEAWMVISWSTLCATDHARSSGIIAGISGNWTCDDVAWPMELCESALMDR